MRVSSQPVVFLLFFFLGHLSPALGQDADGDSMPDAWELQYGLNPNSTNDAGLDPDSDWLANLAEYQAGTCPTNADTDGDSLNDGWEIRYRTSATNTWEEFAKAKTIAEIGSCMITGLGQSIFIDSQIAYVTAPIWPSTLVALDISDPTNPQPLFVSDIPATKAYAVSGTVYAVDGSGWNQPLRIIDATDPPALTVLGSYTAPGIWGSLVMQSNIVYVDDCYTGMLMLDVTDPTNIVLMGSFPVSSEYVGVDLALVDGGCLLYARPTTYWVGGGLFSVCVTNPAEPQVMGSFACSADLVAACGTLAAVFDHTSLSVHLVDVSDPLNLTPVGTYETGEYASDIAMDSNFLYLAGESNSVSVIDISDPQHPVRRGTYGHDMSCAMAVASNLIYLSTSGQPWEDTFHVLRVSAADANQDGMFDNWEMVYFGSLTNEATGDVDADGISNWGEFTAGLNPTNSDQDADGLIDGDEVSTYKSDPRKADTDGDGIADAEEVVAGADGFVTDPTDADTDHDGLPDGWEVAYSFNPTVAGEQDGDADVDGLTNLQELQNGTSPRSSDTDGDSLPDQWEVTYGSTPSNAAGGLPDLVFPLRSSIPVTAYELKVYSNQLVTAQASSLTTYDVSDPTHPRWLAAQPMSWCTRVLIDRGIVFASDSQNLGTYDISVPGTLTPLGSYTAPDSIDYMSLESNVLALSQYAGILLLDVSDPANPSLLSTVPTVAQFVTDVQLHSGYAYVTIYTQGLEVIDVSVPTSPADFGLFELDGHLHELAVQSNWLFMGSNAGGLRVLDITCPTNPALAATVPENGWTLDMADNRWFLHTMGNTVAVYDVTVPTNPAQVGTYSESVYGLDVCGSNLYVGTASSIQILEIRFADNDRDGMLDSWETQHFGSTTNEPLDDADGDGIVNLGEFRGGLNPTNADQDADGIADGWEVANNFSPTNSSDATADADGDHMSNYGEFRAGTDPRDATSVWEGQAEFGPDEHHLVVSWPSIENRTYRVNRSTNLLEGFQIIATNIPACPPINVYTDAVNDTERVYYRPSVE